MRLLKRGQQTEVTLTKDLVADIPPYAILSHTWGEDEDEVTFDDLEKGKGMQKVEYTKIRFCETQANKDGLQHFWVDTCCINKANQSELSEAITSMFRWYQQANRCYVFLSDVSVDRDGSEHTPHLWEAAFRQSRWFTRGWTLQELLAPSSVEFFSREGRYLGSKQTLEDLIHEITSIPTAALRGKPLTHFPDEERLRWTNGRQTKKTEDLAYCLLGIFGISMSPRYGEGDLASKRLRDKISKRRDDLSTSRNEHWIVSRSANQLYTGRKDLLQKLVDTIQNSFTDHQRHEQCRIVISGLGGQGKSEICLQIAHLLRQHFWGVFWIDVSTTDLAERSFVHVARNLSLSASTWEDARLGIANLKHPWLLVLDNADDPEVDYQQYFPDGLLGVVMLTSRNDECQQYATGTSIALKGLANKEARDLLLKAARIPADQYNLVDHDATAVAGLLQSHPLALIQAGAFISRCHCTLAEYPNVYEQQRQRLLTFRPAQARSRYRDVYATFEVSADMLATSATEAAQDALQLLPLLAVCGPRQIPLLIFERGWRRAQTVPKDRDDNVEDDNVDLLTPWHVAHLPSLTQVQNESWDSFRLVEAVQLLKAFSLVTIESTDDHVSVSMHALVHAWARDRQDSRQRHQNWLQMGCLMAVGVEDEYVSTRHNRQLQPHLEALLGAEVEAMFTEEPVVMVARMLVRCGWLLYSQRSDSQLSTFIKRILTYLQLDELIVEHRWVGLYDLMGRNLVNSGKLRKAISTLEVVVKIREQKLAEDDPYRLASQHKLARAYRANGQVKEAVALLEKVVTTKQRSLAEDYPSRLASQHLLAGTYYANGQVKKAVTLLEKVVTIRQESLAEDHPDRLASQHELARVYHANGQVKEAVTLLEKVVTIKQRLLAEDHPSRLTSEHNLAILKWDLGRHTEALNVMARVVELRKKSLDENHPPRQESESWLKSMQDQMTSLAGV